MCQQLLGLEAPLISSIQSTFLISSIPQSISLLNQYQDIISYQMQFECITFHSGKFLQMCKCVIQPMKRIKNQFYTETFQFFLYTGSF